MAKGIMFLSQHHIPVVSVITVTFTPFLANVSARICSLQPPCPPIERGRPGDQGGESSIPDRTSPPPSVSSALKIIFGC